VLHIFAPVLLALNSVQHFTNNMQRVKNSPHIPNNLGSSGGQTFLHNPIWCPFKIGEKKTPEYRSTSFWLTAFCTHHTIRWTLPLKLLFYLAAISPDFA
jgi:hypothetical protein